MLATKLRSKLFNLINFKPNLLVNQKSISSSSNDYYYDYYARNLSPNHWNRSEFRVLIKQIQQEFYGYKGGSVDLIKDDVTGMATICLNQPERKNSFSGSMMAQLLEVLMDLEHWKEGKCVLIYGADKFFCSGGDLQTVRKIATYEGGKKMGLLMQHNWLRLQSLPMITCALVQGAALGGGAELLTACDFRLMTSAAKIGFVHIKLGITAAWGGGSRLAQIIGPKNALKMMITGQRLGAEEAMKIGLVDAVFDEDDYVFDNANNWINMFANHHIDALRACKNIVNQSKLLPLELSLEQELEQSSTVWGGVEHIKAIDSNIKHK